MSIGRRRLEYRAYARHALGVMRLPAGVPAMMDELYRDDQQTGREPNTRVIDYYLRPYRKRVLYL